MFFTQRKGKRSVSVNVFFISVNKQTKKKIKYLVSYRIGFHDLSLGKQSCTSLRHSGMGNDLVKLIYYIAFDKNAGLLEQQALVKRVARNWFVLIK